MSDENHKPDVVVVGMPSCGKTVFFTVLGKKFTNLVDGRRVAPLGFRMSTCDKSTATVVNVAYDRLRSGNWPEATKAGQIMPLRWEVFTGNRRIFELFSMDVAGETFKKAFDIGEDGDFGGKSSRNHQTVRSQHPVKDSGDELYREGDASAETQALTVAETDEERAADELKMAISSAKAVCFMVNVALPDVRRERKTGSAEEKKLLRFRNSVLNMYLSLRERPELRAKTIIVLTQTHLHEGEIERAGGPVMYLGDVCGGEASELCNLVKEYGIPVIAVSAINEERDTNELPVITSPDDIPSSGLFGFLLAVAGVVADNDKLAAVRKAYFAYQRERAEYLKCPAQEVMLRLSQAKRCHDASDAFVRVCEDYLDKEENFVELGKVSTLSPSTLAMYKRCTKENSEIKEAMEREYLIRDQLWNQVLRRSVVLERQTSKSQEPINIYDEVQEGMLKAFPDRNGSEEFIYGFGEDDLFPGSEASTYDKWIEFNLVQYRKVLDDDIADLHVRMSEMIGAIDSLSNCVGNPDFVQLLGDVKTQCTLFEDKITAFREDWCNGASISLSEVEEIEKKVNGRYSQISEYKLEHFKRVEAIQKIKAEEERRQVRSRRRKAVMIVLALSVLMLLGVHLYCDRRNKDIVRKISAAISYSNYSDAMNLYRSLVPIKWLGVSRTKYLCPNFDERLSLASKNHEIRKSAEKYFLKLKGLREWLDGIEFSHEEVNDVRKECDNVLNSYKSLPPSESFNDICRNGVDIEPRILATQKCELSIRKAIDKIEKIKDGLKEHLRKVAFISEMQEAERQLRGIDSKVDDLNMDSLSNSIVAINGYIGKLQKMAGADDEDTKNTERFRSSAGDLLKRLNARYVEQRNRMLDKMLADIRLAIVSNSVSKAWDRYDAAREFSSSKDEREKLVKLHDEVLDFTVKTYERALLEVEKTANMLKERSAISTEMVDDTRESLKLIDKVKDGLLRRIPDKCNDFKRLESFAKSVHSKLPVIIQIDGVRQNCNQPVDVKNAGQASASILNGTSFETRKKCVYILVLRNELPAGSSRLVRVVDENGKTAGMSIRLSDLLPGINRFEKTMN